VKNIQQILSFPKSPSASSEISPTPSPPQKRHSWKRNASEGSTPRSGSTRMSHTRCK
jgi:hypothetical protein